MHSPKHASSEQMKTALRPIFYDLDERLVAVDDECMHLDVLEMQSRIINLAIAMRNALFSLDELIEISKENDEREARLEGGHNYMSMQQLGVSPGRTRP